MTELIKGRIILSHYSKYIVETNDHKYSCDVSGRFKYTIYNKADYPVVGDYVCFRETNPFEGIIERIEERYSTVKRLAVTKVHDSQIVASNIDIVFICMALDGDFNIKKLNNFISMSYSNNYKSIILLTKSDIGTQVPHKVEQVRNSTSLDLYVLSSLNPKDIDFLLELIGERTCVFLGSSGVGKSTLVNKILGYEHMKTSEIRVSDSQGRHTTVHRELVRLPTGGSIIDTPGIRLPKSYFTENIDSYFEDILEFAKKCKFRNCEHQNEIDCGVLDAIEKGDLSISRYNQYKQAQKVNEFTIKREKEKQRIHEKKMQKRRWNRILIVRCY